MENEVLGYRCPKISERHRGWGIDLPALDVDCLLAEYDNEEIVAFIDYKFKRVGLDPDACLGTSGMRALIKHGTRTGVAVAMAVYDANSWGIAVYPCNEQALALFGHRRYWSEEKFVAKLYEVRGRPMPESVRARCNTTYHLTVDEAGEEAGIG